MKKQLLYLIVLLIGVNACKHDEIIAGPDPYKGYPKDVGQIFLTKCATAGCHNEASKDAAGGLSLASWESLFEGRGDNSVVIPYRPDWSTLMYFINTDTTQGPVHTPTMPLNQPPLTRQEVEAIKNWIASGAPNDKGFVKFSDNPNRSKLYVTNQGCDVVTVFDLQTKLPMRYINVGTSAAIESPHMIKVSPDGQYWYVVFTAGTTIQKYRTADDTYAGQVDIGSGSWNTFTITADSKKAFVVDFNSDGQILYLDLENMAQLTAYKGAGLFNYPHASAVNDADTTLYVSAQNGNFIYKIDITDPFNPEINEISLEPGAAPSVTGGLDPHEILISPDQTKYYVTCQESNEVRVMNSSNDSLLAVIAAGQYPQEMALSTEHDYLFVTCTEDITTFPGKRGSVAIINTNTYELIQKVFTGFQPHGIAIDEARDYVYVTHRNIDPSGPAPHHTGVCGGRNGYVTILNMNTLTTLLGYRAEIGPDPYSVAIKP